MFQKRKSQPFFSSEATSGKQLFKRAATLSAGIFFLWIALHIMPKKGMNIPATEASTDQVIPNKSSTSDNSSGTIGFLKTTQIIAGVLLLALIGYMYFRYKKAEKEKTPIKSLKTLNRIQLAPNQHIYLIECGHEALLIGATNSQITLLNSIPLASLTQDQLDESMRSIAYPFTTPNSTQKETGDFASLLHSYSSANTN